MRKTTIVLLTTLIANCYLASAKIPVTIYYESLCPDSIKFITSQLYPAMQRENIAKYIELNLIPFGKSKQYYINGWQFTCHHGPNECYGNTVQACALNLIAPNTSDSPTQQNLSLDYINCLMGKVEKDATPFVYPTKHCAQGNIDVEKIEKCANSSDGATVLSKMGTITQALRPELKSVPTIVFENVYNQEDQDLAVTNFQAAFCKHIKDNTKQTECMSAAHWVTSLSLLSIVSIALASRFW